MPIKIQTEIQSEISHQLYAMLNRTNSDFLSFKSNWTVISGVVRHVIRSLIHCLKDKCFFSLNKGMPRDASPYEHIGLPLGITSMSSAHRNALKSMAARTVINPALADMGIVGVARSFILQLRKNLKKNARSLNRLEWKRLALSSRAKSSRVKRPAASRNSLFMPMTNLTNCYRLHSVVATNLRSIMLILLQNIISETGKIGHFSNCRFLWRNQAC